MRDIKINKFFELIKIAEIHVDRIQWAYTELKDMFPVNQDKILNLSPQELLLIELLISRFGKLQDFLGSKIINEFLKLTQDYAEQLTMIDKLNKLERLNIIENSELWQRMRDARNHVTHEYPDHPELTARYLNQIFLLTPQLLAILENIKNKIKK